MPGYGQRKTLRFMNNKKGQRWSEQMDCCHDMLTPGMNEKGSTFLHTSPGLARQNRLGRLDAEGRGQTEAHGAGLGAGVAVPLTFTRALEM